MRDILPAVKGEGHFVKDDVSISDVIVERHQAKVGLDERRYLRVGSGCIRPIGRLDRDLRGFAIAVLFAPAELLVTGTERLRDRIWGWKRRRHTTESVLIQPNCAAQKFCLGPC